MAKSEDELPAWASKVETIGKGYTKKRRLVLKPTLEAFKAFDGEVKNPLLDFGGWLDNFEGKVRVAAEQAGVDLGRQRQKVTYQSREWDILELILAIRNVRDAMRKGDPLKLAARALMLGALKAETEVRRKLISTGEAGNKVIHAQKQEREAAARKVVETHSIDLASIEAATDAICALLPEQLRQRDAIRIWIGKNRVKKGSFYRLRQNGPF